MLKDLMARLRGAKSSTDWERAITELQKSVDAAGQSLTLLRSALKSAPFEGTEEEVAALRQRVRDVEDEHQFLAGALEEAKRRHAEVVEAENSAEIEALMAAARKDWDRMARLWRQFDDALAAVAKPLGEIKELHDRIQTANAKAAARGRSEMALRLPGFEVSGRIRNALAQLGTESQSAYMQALIDSDRRTIPEGIPGFEEGRWD